MRQVSNELLQHDVLVFELLSRRISVAAAVVLLRPEIGCLVAIRLKEICPLQSVMALPADECFLGIQNI